MREARRAATEEQILEAARELLREGESFGDLSIEQIASRAGISRPAFYDYYRDKRELLIRLIDESAAAVFQQADELVGGRPSGPAEIPFTIEAAMEWASGSPEIYRAGIEAAAYDEVVGRYWREELLDRFIEVIERRIRSQQAKEITLPVNPRATATSLVLMVMYTLYDHVSREKKVSDKKLVETLVTISVRAVYGPVDEAARKRP
jgi:TetR/AcrR family transcriptional regulator, ethionamide resistance regulator